MTTIATILRAIAQCKRPPVHVFCHPDDHERITAACELLPSVRVVAHQLMPVGRVWVAKDLPDITNPSTP